MNNIDIDKIIKEKAVSEPISEKEGGGYMSIIPGFGLSFIGDGDTIEESLESLRKTILGREKNIRDYFYEKRNNKEKNRNN